MQPEDTLSYALFPAVAKDFLVKKYAMQTKRDVGFEELVEGTAYPL
jgi:oxaloacetate decarboxylase alpha subunit